jgi:integrase
MASVRKQPSGKWLGRYNDPDKRLRSKSFATKGQARAWAEEQEAACRAGSWTDPKRTAITLGEWAPHYFETLAVKPKTMEGYRSLYDTQVAPRWAQTRLDRITLPEVKKWVAGMERVDGGALSASRKRAAHRLLSAMLDLAVEDKRLVRNPAQSLSGKRNAFLPRQPKDRAHRYPTDEDLARLADQVEQDTSRSMGKSDATLVLLLGYCGLRWGEATALRVSDLDLLHRKLSVNRAAVEINGVLSYDLPKTHARRTVTVPSFLAERLAEITAGRAPGALVFTTPQGAPVRSGAFRTKVFYPALEACGIERLRIHDLRHTAASLAVASGANVKDVQDMLGHESAAMTLDTYAALLEGRQSAIAEANDDRARQARAAVVAGRVAAVVPLR